MKNYLFVVSTCFLLCACSSNQDKQAIPKSSDLLKSLTEQNGRACIRTADIDSFGSAERRIITIDAGRKYYLATTLYRCHDLDTSMQAIFRGSFGEVCGNSMSKVITREDSCSIGSIYEFNSRKEAFEALDKIEEMRQEIIEENEKKQEAGN